MSYKFFKVTSIVVERRPVENDERPVNQFLLVNDFPVRVCSLCKEITVVSMRVCIICQV